MHCALTIPLLTILLMVPPRCVHSMPNNQDKYQVDDIAETTGISEESTVPNSIPDYIESVGQQHDIVLSSRPTSTQSSLVTSNYKLTIFGPKQDNTNLAIDRTNVKQKRDIYVFSDTTSKRVLAGKNIVNNVTEVNIAVLLPILDSYRFSIRHVKPALEIAVEKANPELSHHSVKLVVRFRDSKCDIADGINEAINFYVHNQMDVLFGPCCDYSAAPCARQVKYWDLPLITAGAMSRDFGLGKMDMYRTTTRIGNTFDALVEFVWKIALFYNWSKLKIVYHPLGKSHISIRFCHIAVNDLHYGLASKNISSTYEKFEEEEDILNELDDKLGRQDAGKCHLH